MPKNIGPYLQEWSTESINRCEQFSYWYDAICERILHVDLNRRKKGAFNGMLKSRKSGSFTFNQMKSEEHIADLTNNGISRFSSHYYKLHIQKNSIVKVKQHGCENILRPGDAILVDCFYPFQLDFPTTFECYSVKIPRGQLRPLLKDPSLASTMPILGDSPLGKSILHYIHFLLGILSTPQTDDQMQLYFDNLLGLIAAATSASNSGYEAYNQIRPKNKIPQIKEYIIDNLEDPEITPTKVAEHFSISVSYLHKIFSKSQQTFGSFLRDQRLERAAFYLKNQSGKKSTVTDLAYNLGFNDLSHFWRLFRERYGVPPGKYRSKDTI